MVRNWDYQQPKQEYLDVTTNRGMTIAMTHWARIKSNWGWVSLLATETPPFIDNFSTKTTFYRGFLIATFDDTGGYIPLYNIISTYIYHMTFA
jgi:hypothetical protein